MTNVASIKPETTIANETTADVWLYSLLSKGVLKRQHVYAALLLMDCFERKPLAVADVYKYLADHKDDAIQYTSWMFRARVPLYRMQYHLASFIPDLKHNNLRPGREDTYLEILMAVGPTLNTLLVRFLYEGLDSVAIENKMGTVTGSFPLMLKMALDRAAMYIQMRCPR